MLTTARHFRRSDSARYGIGACTSNGKQGAEVASQLPDVDRVSERLTQSSLVRVQGISPTLEIQ